MNLLKESTVNHLTLKYMNVEKVLIFHQNAASEDSHMPDMPEIPSLSSLLEAHATDWPFENPSIVNGQISGHDDCHRCDTMWTVCDTAIMQGHGDLYSGNDYDLNEGDAHMIITAIAEGWAEAAKSQYWNAHWDALRQIDQICHAICGPVERISMLYTLIRLFKVLPLTHIYYTTN